MTPMKTTATKTINFCIFSLLIPFSLLILFFSGCNDDIDKIKDEIKDKIKKYLSYIETHQLEKFGSFDPNSVHIVDQKNKAFLMRGNVPLSKPAEGQRPQFLYEKVMKRAMELLDERGEKPSSTPQLIDVTLLNKFTDHVQVDVERKYFEDNPQKGHFVYMQTFGTPIPPIKNSKEIFNKKEIKYFMIDDLDSYTKKLRDLLENNREVPTIIYVHCQAGKDRTGEVIGSYMMRYMGQSFEEALAIDNKIAGREIGTTSKNALEWYSVFLSLGD